MFLNFYSMRQRYKKMKKILKTMGIGSGEGVFSSGEKVAFNILLKNSYFSNNTSFCIFDVGANVGKYTTLCLKYMGGVLALVKGFLVVEKKWLLISYLKIHILATTLHFVFLM